MDNCKIFFFVFLISSLITLAQKTNANNIDINDFDKLKIRIDSLEEQVKALSVEKGYFSTILDSERTIYTTIISLIFFTLGLISFCTFRVQRKKLSKLIKSHDKQDKQIKSISEEFCRNKNELDYTYANVCNILAGIECSDTFKNFNKSFFYYMRTIKLLFSSGKYGGILSNLRNANIALRHAIDHPQASTQGWKLEKRHQDEIEQTFLELSKIKNDNNILVELENIKREFYGNLMKIKG